MKLNAYGVYDLYMNLQNHFTSRSFNFNTGRLHCFTAEKFVMRKDKKIFSYLAAKYEDWDLKDLFIANMVINPKIHVSALLNSDSHDVMVDWQRRTQALAHIYEKELRELFEDQNPLEPPEAPFIVDAYFCREISPETVAITDYFTKFGVRVKDEFLWKKCHLMLTKYRLLLTFDNKKFRDILLGNLQGYINRKGLTHEIAL
jgi:hypothetical protein